MKSETNTTSNQLTASERIRAAREQKFQDAPESRHTGRNIIIGTLATLAVAGAVNNPFASAERGNSGPTQTTEVQPGDTQWTIAERIAPNSDPRETVYEMEQKTADDEAHAGAMVQPGDKVVHTADGTVVDYVER
jgi:hypothetical protein